MLGRMRAALLHNGTADVCQSCLNKEIGVLKPFFYGFQLDGRWDPGATYVGPS